MGHLFAFLSVFDEALIRSHSTGSGSRFLIGAAHHEGSDTLGGLHCFSGRSSLGCYSCDFVNDIVALDCRKMRLWLIGAGRLVFSLAFTLERTVWIGGSMLVVWQVGR